jgi:hypothetical protein
MVGGSLHAGHASRDHPRLPNQVYGGGRSGARPSVPPRRLPGRMPQPALPDVYWVGDGSRKPDNDGYRGCKLVGFSVCVGIITTRRSFGHTRRVWLFELGHLNGLIPIDARAGTSMARWRSTSTRRLTLLSTQPVDSLRGSSQFATTVPTPVLAATVSGTRKQSLFGDSEKRWHSVHVCLLESVSEVVETENGVSFE